MSPEHATALETVLRGAMTKLELNGDLKGGALASQIASARLDIDRAIRMLRLVSRPAQPQPPQGALDQALARTLKSWDEAHPV